MKKIMLLILIAVGLLSTACDKEEISDVEATIQQIEDFGATKATIYSSAKNLTDVSFYFEGVFCMVQDDKYDYCFPMKNLLHVAYRWNKKHVTLYFE